MLGGIKEVNYFIIMAFEITLMQRAMMLAMLTHPWLYLGLVY